MRREHFIFGKTWTWLEFEYQWYMGHFCCLYLRCQANQNFICIFEYSFLKPCYRVHSKTMYTTSKIQLLSTVFTLSVYAQTIHTCKKQLCVWSVVCIGCYVFCAARSKQIGTPTACMYVTIALKITLTAGIMQYIFILFICKCVYLEKGSV